MTIASMTRQQLRARGAARMCHSFRQLSRCDQSTLRLHTTVSHAPPLKSTARSGLHCHPETAEAAVSLPDALTRITQNQLPGGAHLEAYTLHAGQCLLGRDALLKC